MSSSDDANQQQHQQNSQQSNEQNVGKQFEDGLHRAAESLQSRLTYQIHCSQAADCPGIYVEPNAYCTLCGARIHQQCGLHNEHPQGDRTLCDEHVQETSVSEARRILSPIENNDDLPQFDEHERNNNSNSSSQNEVINLIDASPPNKQNELDNVNSLTDEEFEKIEDDAGIEKEQSYQIGCAHSYSCDGKYTAPDSQCDVCNIPIHGRCGLNNDVIPTSANEREEKRHLCDQHVEQNSVTVTHRNHNQYKQMIEQNRNNSRRSLPPVSRTNESTNESNAGGPGDNASISSDSNELQEPGQSQQSNSHEQAMSSHISVVSSGTNQGEKHIVHSPLPPNQSAANKTNSSSILQTPHSSATSSPKSAPSTTVSNSSSTHSSRASSVQSSPLLNAKEGARKLQVTAALREASTNNQQYHSILQLVQLLATNYIYSRPDPHLDTTTMSGAHRLLINKLTNLSIITTSGSFPVHNAAAGVEFTGFSHMDRNQVLAFALMPIPARGNCLIDAIFAAHQGGEWYDGMVGPYYQGTPASDAARAIHQRQLLYDHVVQIENRALVQARTGYNDVQFDDFLRDLRSNNEHMDSIPVCHTFCSLYNCKIYLFSGHGPSGHQNETHMLNSNYYQVEQVFESDQTEFKNGEPQLILGLLHQQHYTNEGRHVGHYSAMIYLPYLVVLPFQLDVLECISPLYIIEIGCDTVFNLNVTLYSPHLSTSVPFGTCLRVIRTTHPLLTADCITMGTLVEYNYNFEQNESGASIYHIVWHPSGSDADHPRPYVRLYNLRALEIEIVTAFTPAREADHIRNEFIQTAAGLFDQAVLSHLHLTANPYELDRNAIEQMIFKQHRDNFHTVYHVARQLNEVVFLPAPLKRNYSENHAPVELKILDSERTDIENIFDVGYISPKAKQKIDEQKRKAEEETEKKLETEQQRKKAIEQKKEIEQKKKDEIEKQKKNRPPKNKNEQSNDKSTDQTNRRKSTRKKPPPNDKNDKPTSPTTGQQRSTTPGPQRAGTPSGGRSGYDNFVKVHYHDLLRLFNSVHDKKNQLKAGENNKKPLRSFAGQYHLWTGLPPTVKENYSNLTPDQVNELSGRQQKSNRESRLHFKENVVPLFEQFRVNTKPGDDDSDDESSDSISGSDSDSENEFDFDGNRLDKEVADEMMDEMTRHEQNKINATRKSNRTPTNKRQKPVIPPLNLSSASHSQSDQLSSKRSNTSSDQSSARKKSRTKSTVSIDIEAEARQLASEETMNYDSNDEHLFDMDTITLRSREKQEAKQRARANNIVGLDWGDSFADRMLEKKIAIVKLLHKLGPHRRDSLPSAFVRPVPVRVHGGSIASPPPRLGSPIYSQRPTTDRQPQPYSGEQRQRQQSVPRSHAHQRTASLSRSPSISRSRSRRSSHTHQSQRQRQRTPSAHSHRPQRTRSPSPVPSHRSHRSSDRRDREPSQPYASHRSSRDPSIAPTLIPPNQVRQSIDSYETSRAVHHDTVSHFNFANPHATYAQLHQQTMQTVRASMKSEYLQAKLDLFEGQERSRHLFGDMSYGRR